MLGFVYFKDQGRRMPSSQETIIKVSTNVGIIFGQVFFGSLADVVGRKRMYGIELTIAILATIGQAFSSASSSFSITSLLALWRIFVRSSPPSLHLPSALPELIPARWESVSGATTPCPAS